MVVLTHDQVSAGIPGETVVLDTKAGVYHGVDEVGSFIWESLREPTTVDALLRAVTTAYDVGEQECLEDLQLFLNELLSARLIEVRHDDGA